MAEVIRLVTNRKYESHLTTFLLNIIMVWTAVLIAFLLQA
jgi:hypothetical protein